MHFEVAVAISGAIAPSLYVRLRKAQVEQRRQSRVLLTDLSLGDGLPTSYTPVDRLDCDAEPETLTLNNLTETSEVSIVNDDIAFSIDSLGRSMK